VDPRGDQDERGEPEGGVTVSRYEPITERDIEAPEEDATEQARPIDDSDLGPALDPPDDPEVDEADAAEQRIVVEYEDEYRG
jgi:hypothetical protein